MMNNRSERRGPTHVATHDYQTQVDVFVHDVIRTVDYEMRGKPPHMVYEMLTTLLHNRLPGVAVDDHAMRGIAAEIAFGLRVA
jgi:coenzyme F420-reducing hydrogenase gamma subunit